MQIRQFYYDQLMKDFNGIFEKLASLNPSHILKIANLLNDARLLISAYDTEIGSKLKKEADKLKNFGNYDNADPVEYFDSGSAILRKGIEDFILKLEIID